MNRITATVTVFVALALTGCASDSSVDPASEPTATIATPSATTDPTPSAMSPSPSPSPSPTPAPSPQTTPVAAPANPCEDPGASLVGLPGIDFDRYAAICLGMSFTEATAAMLGPAIEGKAQCPWYAELLAGDDLGLYVAAVSGPEDPGAEITLFRMTWLDDPALAAGFDAPATAAGISVGSTTAEVKAAYPSATSITFNDSARGPRDQIVATGPNTTAIVFDVTSGIVSDMYWGAGISNGASAELCAL